MCLTCERIRLTFGLFSLLLHGFKKFLFHFHFVHLERIGTTLSNNHLVRINKIDHVNSRIDKKKERVGVFSTMFSIHRCVFHSHKIWKRVKENNEKKKEQKKIKKSTTLDLDLHLDSSNHELSFKLLNFFFFF